MILKRRLARVAVFLLCLAPAAWLVIAALTDNLSANPIKDITEETGTWTLRFLLITLCVTPFRKLTGWNEMIEYRRMLGLFAFFYGFLLFLTYRGSISFSRSLTCCKTFTNVPSSLPVSPVSW